MMLGKLRSFLEDVKAVAAVEFALILPLLLTLYVGSIEAATLYSTDHKVSTVASTLADLVARQNGEISGSTLTNYFVAASTIMHPYTTTGLVQIVSLLKIDEEGVATVKWSVPSGTPNGHPVDSIYPLSADTKINELARGADGWLVVSEIEYPANSIVGLIMPGPIRLKHVQYYLPRFPKEIVYKPDL